MKDKPPFKQSTDEGIGAWCYKCNGTICLSPECLTWHQNGKMPINEFMEFIEEKRIRDSQSKPWS